MSAYWSRTFQTDICSREVLLTSSQEHLQCRTTSFSKSRNFEAASEKQVRRRKRSINYTQNSRKSASQTSTLMITSVCVLYVCARADTINLQKCHRDKRWNIIYDAKFTRSVRKLFQCSRRGVFRHERDIDIVCFCRDALQMAIRWGDTRGMVHNESCGYKDGKCPHFTRDVWSYVSVDKARTGTCCTI